MAILTLNCGSSSVKYQVYDWKEKRILGVGVVERIAEKSSRLKHKSASYEEYEAEKSCPDHKDAIAWILRILTNPDKGCLECTDSIRAVGHRIVHGADLFTKSVIVDDSVLTKFETISHLAPLHNPVNIAGIRAAQKILPNIPHCAIIDTAWHQTMPATSYMYALPYNWYENYKIRRYGFHGTSYIYTAKRASVLLGKNPMKTNLIIAHIGNGSSICAVKDGKSYDTSMGMTPLEGLMMGTRSGDIDPAIMLFMMAQENISPGAMDSILNKKSGVLGVTDKFIDRRDVHAGVKRADRRCILAQDLETYRIRKYIGAYYATLGSVDAVVFTAGVGELNPAYRLKALRGLEKLGVEIDERKNAVSRTRNAETCISSDNSSIKILVIPTDEELVMTEDTQALVDGTYDIHTAFKYSFQNRDYRNKLRDSGLPADIESNPELRNVLIQ
ncbi:Acetate kinase [Olavius algarvensis spirochete endosymbiont]|uniref:acetate kinase n=1 Tax=Olavius algarvensis spirochete endosymbiont TaxID=260710 RepID=UPI000F28A412|nr:acetate kinase [Olavius algarvensis spirochete endosymbiont]CAD7838111.1 MAG: Acetate kinase (EC 2.7.2.1) [Olavius algarvensis spirochete endosymbiont]VDB00131.1 Acetate kinase [Olavius algarvensis spirochete endosymbiont]